MTQSLCWIWVDFDLTDSEAFAYSITGAKGLMKFYIDVLFILLVCMQYLSVTYLSDASVENGGLCFGWKISSMWTDTWEH